MGDNVPDLTQTKSKGDKLERLSLISSLWELAHKYQFPLASSLQDLATRGGKSLDFRVR